MTSGPYFLDMTHHANIALAQMIIEDGFNAHDDELTELLDRARLLNVAPVLIETVCDRLAPVVVRQRALGRLIGCIATACSPEEVQTVNAEPLGRQRSAFDLAFDRLLRAWNSHQHLRQAYASIAALYRSRAELDDARLAMTHVRAQGIRSQPAGPRPGMTVTAPELQDAMSDLDSFDLMAPAAPKVSIPDDQAVVHRDVEPCLAGRP